MTEATKDAAIRPAAPADAGTILRLIRELAAFEGLAEQVRAAEADILRDGFGARPRFQCLLAELDGQAVGFALYFYIYSTFEGRPGIYLEDLYVAEAARGHSIGRRLMARLATIALEQDCRRIDLAMLHWNPARRFYERLGLTQVADWLPFRLEGEALRQLADQG